MTVYKPSQLTKYGFILARFHNVCNQINWFWLTKDRLELARLSLASQTYIKNEPNATIETSCNPNPAGCHPYVACTALCELFRPQMLIGLHNYSRLGASQKRPGLFPDPERIPCRPGLCNESREADGPTR